MVDVNNAVQIKLFWDIDGTLLRTNGAAAIPFADAVKILPELRSKLIGKLLVDSLIMK